MRLSALIRSALAATLLVLVLPLAEAQEVSSDVPLPVFEFHSGFWLNLHHTLYHDARLGRTLSSPPAGSAITGLSPAEQRTWDSAVSLYAGSYANKDLLFSLEMVLIKNQLGDFETCEDLAGLKKKTCDAGLPPKLTQALDSAAPIYRAHLWPEHDRLNRRWIASVAPLVRHSALELSHRLAEIYETPWPRNRIRVDVTAFANAQGAYTTVDPLRVTVSSTDPRNQNAEALEILFHEASHGISDTVQDAIVRECRQRDKPVPRDLWHALLFYTTGEVIQSLMKSDPSANSMSLVNTYTPYAVRENLYKRGWEDYLRVLNQYWQPYLDGKVTFDDSIAHMVSAL
jgi:hypothetical protein